VNDLIALAHAGRCSLHASADSANARGTHSRSPVAHDATDGAANGSTYCSARDSTLAHWHLIRNALALGQICLIAAHVDALRVDDRAAVQRAATGLTGDQTQHEYWQPNWFQHDEDSPE
jgi:aspartyl aminopeptidase